MQTISPEFLDELIDFTPQGGNASKSVGKLQREGTVAAFNMLAYNGCAYLADEVGMGKTYVALGVMSLLRYFDPHTRVIVIAPRQNIQEKWKKELTNFVRNNWKIIGNRVKSLESTPVWEPVVCGNLPIFAREALLNQDRDFFLRMTSFSLSAKNIEDRKRSRDLLVDAIPWLRNHHIDVSSPEGFLDTYAVALNGAIPDADLVIVDEAHNLKQGFGENVSNRNRVMGLGLGHESGNEYRRDWFVPKAKKVLFLSATPFEDDYSAIHRQMQIFGFGGVTLREPDCDERFDISSLSDPEADPALKRRIVERLLIRRTSGIVVGGKKYTKNMYRREWRRGGVKTFDEPISITDPHTRLIVALMQKKVSEILQTEKFNNSFQIGMLSSFESFSQDVNTAMRHVEGGSSSESQDGQMDRGATFDGSEQQTNLRQEERDGIDSNAITQIAHSFEERFEKRLPHPKLDRVVETLSDVFQSGEKALIFVRRVATVRELAGKLNEEFNSWVQQRMESFLPNLKSEIRAIFRQYRREHRIDRLNISEAEESAESDTTSIENDSTAIELRQDLELDNDTGGIASFFEWFFRGLGPPGMLSGAAFQKNRLSATASVYSTLFEDNYMAELLGALPPEVLESLTSRLGITRDECVTKLRDIAYAYFSERSRQKEGYPRLYVFESYQVAALTLVTRSNTELGQFAAIILQERYPDHSLGSNDTPPSGFPSPEPHLNTQTVFTELRKHEKLREELWPVEYKGDFRVTFRRREQRRELFSAIARLGAAYIDLYLLAMKHLGSFELRQREQEDDVAPRLAQEYVTLLDEQRHLEGFHAFYELSETAKTFDTLVAVNFPDIEQQKLPSLARYFGTVLGQQVPVGEVSGQVNKRVVGQFRMPGFPLVMISTDVLQEGEDLHTFCKDVLHYGIAWTPSSIEQRTGRIDRIGGLVQRNLDGRATEPEQKELIQVFYPHLRDTVELLQVRRVLRRLNAFMELMHQDLSRSKFDESSIDANSAVHKEMEDIPQYTAPLKSAFEIKEPWLDGKLDDSNVTTPDWEAQMGHFEYLRDELTKLYHIELQLPRSNHEFEGQLRFDDANGEHANRWKSLSGTQHAFIIRLKSHVAGEQTLLQCESAIADIDLNDESNMDAIAKLVSQSQHAKVCVEPRITRYLDRVFVRQEILFDPDMTQKADLVHVFESVVPIAAQLHRKLAAFVN